MTEFSKSISNLIDTLCGLPGIGPRTAQRIVLYLLANNRPLGHRMAENLDLALTRVSECKRCRNFSEQPLCEICNDEGRNKQICVVESPIDVMAVEKSGSYKGYYFVLHGHLSPMDDVGPEQLGLDMLDAMLKESDCTEVILATNPTVEGEITAHYIKQRLANTPQIRITRIAHGVPMGGELEYIDGGTIARALSGRTIYTEYADETN